MLLHGREASTASQQTAPDEIQGFFSFPPEKTERNFKRRTICRECTKPNCILLQRKRITRTNTQTRSRMDHRGGRVECVGAEGRGAGGGELRFFLVFELVEKYGGGGKSLRSFSHFFPGNKKSRENLPRQTTRSDKSTQGCAVFGC